ncbi:hypothetical protein C8Q78DRAFT_1082713 [Trametes maxima]|nr:hypothetical protein C8Q78DRAFT_1082713 [Trametes maxima]
MTRSTRRLLRQSGLYKKAFSHKQSRIEFGAEGISTRPTNQTGASATLTPVPLVTRAASAQSPTAHIVRASQDTRSPLRARSFPDEVVRIILSYAWLSLRPSDPMVRWALFRAVSGVNHQWRDGIVRVATRYVEVCLRSNADLAGYLTVGKMALQKHLSDPRELLHSSTEDAGQEMKTGATLGSRPVPAETLLSKVFKRATISLYVPRDEEVPAFSAKQVLFGRGILQLGQPTQDLGTGWASSDTEHLTLLRRIVPNCGKVSIGTGHCTGLRSALTRTILEFVASLQSPTHLDFDTFLETSDTRDKPRDEVTFPSERHALLIPPLPGIRTVRFKEYPSCSCENRELGSGHAESFCFAFQLMRALPNVERLQIDAPVLLKHIIPPPSLHTLILRVAQGAPAQGAVPSQFITNYNLSAAINSGLFKSPLPSGRRPQVLIDTTYPELDIAGWPDAVAACEGCGVALVRRYSKLRDAEFSRAERMTFLELRK